MKDEGEEHLDLEAGLSPTEEEPSHKLWEVWPGYNCVWLNGACLTAPCEDAGVTFCTWLLMIGNAVLFWVLVAGPVHWSLIVLSAAILVFAAYSLLRAHFTEPGIVPREHPDTARPELSPTVLLDGVRLRLKWCDSCRMFRPLRSKHCPSCNNCILSLDHHCPWVACIGQRNYRYFVAFTTSGLVLTVFVGVVSLYRLIERTANTEDNFMETMTNEWAATVELLMSCMISCCLFGLVCFHWGLVRSGLTTAEYLRPPVYDVVPDEYDDELGCVPARKQPAGENEEKSDLPDAAPLAVAVSPKGPAAPGAGSPKAARLPTSSSASSLQEEASAAAGDERRLRAGGSGGLLSSDALLGQGSRGPGDFPPAEACPRTGLLLSPGDGRPLLLRSLGMPGARLMPPVPANLHCERQVTLRGSTLRPYNASHIPWLETAPPEPEGSWCAAFSANCRELQCGPLPEPMFDLRAPSALPLEDEAYEQLDARNGFPHHHHHRRHSQEMPALPPRAAAGSGAGNMFSNQYWDRQRREYEMEQQKKKEGL